MKIKSICVNNLADDPGYGSKKAPENACEADQGHRRQRTAARIGNWLEMCLPAMGRAVREPGVRPCEKRTYPERIDTA